MTKLTSILMAGAALAFAQDKVTVPLSNPSQPVSVKAHLIVGSITVTGGGAAGQVVVESGKSSREDRNTPTGMHRIDMVGEVLT